MEPARQLAVWLMTQPHPGHLHRHCTGTRVASLVDALIRAAIPAVVRRRCQPEVSRDRPTIGEPSPEHLAPKHGRNVGPDPAQLRQLPYPRAIAILWLGIALNNFIVHGLVRH